MAFGKRTNDIRRLKNMVTEDKQWRIYIESEERTNRNWRNKWSWLQNEYTILQGKLSEISKDSAFLQEVNKVVKEPDKRSIKPIPESTNHEYGWLASIPGFDCEQFGPDVMQARPLPDIYRIVK